MFRWFCRCIPGISTLCLVALLAVAFSNVNTTSHGSPPRLRTSQKVVIFYSVFIHLNTLSFALRLCWSILIVKNKIKNILQHRRKLCSGPDCDVNGPYVDHIPAGRIRSEEDTLLPLPNGEGNDLLENDHLADEEIVHAIILPNYGEDLDTLKSTLSVLASHPRAATQYEVR